MVVDDSALMRKIISDMINEENDMEVVAVARDGEELLTKLDKIKVDIITLDVEMPKMDGITALRKLKEKQTEVKVIMLSSLTTRSSSLTLECLDLGAAEFLAKPSGSISLDINNVKFELVSKIRMVSKIKKPLIIPKKTIISERKKTEMPNRAVSNKRFEAVLIGASTGGPKALYEVITALPEDLGVPVFVVQHMPKGFTKAFAERLNNNSKLKVVEGAQNQNIEKNCVYIAPGGFHMEISKDKKISLNEEPAIWGVRPAVDKLFISAVEVYKGNLLSVVLTGMGRDGAKGTETVKDAGGYTISEDESTCTIYGMPKACFETGKVDEVIGLHDVSTAIIKLVKK
ncbi:protein-glutamate methylesterase/protein-glutamine glutaminase [Clostridium cavendishii]